MSNRMIQVLDNLCNIQIKLSVPLLVRYYDMGLNDQQIADRTGKTQQGVSDYKLRHIEEIKPLIQDRNAYAAIDAAYLAQQARSRLKDIINTCDDFDKKDIIPLVAITDRLSTQSRLYAGESTSNLSVSSVNSNLAELEARKKELEAKFEVMEVGNDGE